MNWNSQTAIVVGASSGIGAAVARRLAREGWTVALVARREEKLRALAEAINRRANAKVAHVFVHDVRHFDEVPALFDRIVEEIGGMGLLVYASGTMAEVEPNEYNFAKDRQMVEVNLLGMMAWMNQAADLVERVQHGILVGIGSVAGDRGRKGQPGYNTSKGAQAIYLESLRNRLAQHDDVRVITIKPGYVATEMTAHLGPKLWMISADEAAQRIVRAIDRSRGEVYVPRRWRFVSLALRHIPSFIFKKLEI
jgi:short-subunit dehydrogenase